MFLIVERCKVEACLEREQHYIDSYDTTNPKKGYNICPTAGSLLGLTWTLSEEKRRIVTKRNRETAKKRSEEWRRKVSDNCKKRNAEVSADPVRAAKRKADARRASALAKLSGRSIVARQFNAMRLNIKNKAKLKVLKES